VDENVRRADGLELAPNDFGAFIDDCQRLAGVPEGSDEWRRELSGVIRRIPRTLTEPQRAVVLSTLWRLFLHAARRVEQGRTLEVPAEAVAALDEGDLSRGFCLLLTAWQRSLAAGEGDRDPRVGRGLEYLAENAADPCVNLAVVASHVNLSKWHFDRLLTRQTGAGFRAHLTDLRMRKARELLETTSLGIKEVSARVGYKQLSEFDRHFRRRFGVTPTWLRRTANNHR
jgi:AraC-like DNA-binding protein